MNYKDWIAIWEEYLKKNPQAYYVMTKNYNWTIEPEKPKVTMEDKLNLECTYKNDMVYKKTLQSLMDEIDGALQIGDKDWFERASKEYNALKMECVI